jgi:HlyD family secretion protein
MTHQRRAPGQRRIRWSGYALATTLTFSGVACSQVDQAAAPEAAEAQSEQPVVVDVAVAEVADEEGRVYTGTTEPLQQVSLRSQAEGQLLNLNVDVGDTVQQGQTLGTLDNTLLQTAVGEAEAELAARQFEVARAEAELADIRTLIEQARARLQQAQNDAQRLQSLAGQGAISTQEAEQAQTTLKTAQQAFQSAQEQLRTRQQAVSAAQQRVTAQQAMVQQAQKRLSYATLSAPMTGLVLERLAEPGDLIQPGQAVVSLGDMSEIHVITEVADNNRQEFNLGQSVSVQMDAFPGETFSGRITRISPVADTTSRLIPVEITLPNPDNRIGSGLLARVSHSSDQSSPILIPQSALEINEGNENQIFVISTTDPETIVEARTIQIGERTTGQVEILSGLSPGELYVTRSSQPLEPGQVVEKSLVSESP